MPRSCIVDSSALVALLEPREQHADWARAAFSQQPVPWFTCEPGLGECFFLLSSVGQTRLKQLLRTGSLRVEFDLASEQAAVLALMDKYEDVPMSLADACFVRMTEILPEPLVLTTDRDFRIYRRHSRLVVPCLIP